MVEIAVFNAVKPYITHPIIYNAYAEPGKAINKNSFNNPDNVPSTIFVTAYAQYVLSTAQDNGVRQF